MSDIKRAILTTLEPQKVNDKAVKKQCKTVRICVPLPESNEDNCPEFNYKDELAALKKKLKQNNKDPVVALNGSDPFDNDDDVRRIALEMEAKYGSGVGLGSKKKRRGRKDDYVDIGAGYDESDSFIDNTDGYDEIIPPNVTTARGGFYINCGALEFKTDDEVTSEVSSSSSEESDSDDDSKTDDKLKRKRPLDSTDDEGDADSNASLESQGEKQKNPDKPNISMQQAIKKKLFSPDKIQVKKQKLAEQQKQLERKAELNADQADKDSAKENKKPMKMSSVDDAIESVINRAEEVAKAPEKISPPKSEDNLNNLAKNSEDRLSYSSEPESDLVMKTEPVKLPENLPSDIVGLIEEIKKVARDYKDGGKVKFFNGEVNTMLLNLEYKCKILGRSSRVKVYDHLAHFVRCRKETLIKRAKNLVVEDEQRKLRLTIDKLKTHVDQLMPSLITVYNKECQRIMQKKFSPEAANDDELKNLKTPRRRFPLSEDIKKMLRDIVSLKKRCFLHEGKKKDDLEALMTNYLKAEIQILWPPNWMSMVVLKKFCSNNALKTPTPKAVDPVAQKHSQKPPVPSSASSSVINFTAGNNLTITPVNLTEKFSNNNVNPPIPKTDAVAKQAAKEKVAEKRPELKENKDNGVIVINSMKNKEEPVIPKSAHCQIIDLTDSITSKVSDNGSVGKSSFAKEHPEPKVFENTLKNKYPDINITPSSKPQSGEVDEIQIAIDSLKALHKLSSPSKKDSAKSSSVSVIALNKNYSNSGSGQGQGGGATTNDRTNFSGSIGFQDEFQKQFISTINNLKSPPHSSKSTYNRCS
ncbi:hypothetical protein GWI33_006255 [Rhynchophorus ferrugineus]|uniref:Ubinuclein-1 n=1 Tax=Rhynchophorus ferrugineus TaxID=354439 RepID=A0A834MJ40_RHYFE|nr:hypothetical protein GWI33_006255 [Rhynchophorus ferrugineus]